MKKFSLLFLMALMMALPSSLAMAGRYSYLEFTSNTSEIYTVATNNLEILVNGENLIFSNTDLMIPLSSLISMEFTEYDDSPAAIDTVKFDGNGLVTVYNIDGTALGSFDSYTDALSSLGKGVYVVKDTIGNSLKISVGK